MTKKAKLEKKRAKAAALWEKRWWNRLVLSRKLSSKTLQKYYK